MNDIARDRIDSANSALSIANNAMGVLNQGKTYLNRYHERRGYSVKVTSLDPIYVTAQVWLLGQVPDTKKRKLSVTTYNRWSRDGSRTRATRLMLADNVKFSIMVDGYMIKIDKSDGDSEPSNDDSETTPSSSSSSGQKISTITFWSRTMAGRDAVISKLEQLNRLEEKSDTPRLKVVNSWGSWDDRDDLPGRPLASVAVDAGLKESLREDMEVFLESEERYNRVAVPWHRGYLLHGPPGTGKTSLVRALATEFNLDVWYISLGDLRQENKLMELISNVESRSILLLEDVDTVKFATSRVSTSPGDITLSSLLNALDGVMTPHGLITFMTTNHLEKLDPALTRPGRMDVVTQIGLPTIGEIAELFSYYYGEPIGNIEALGGAVRATGKLSVSMAGVSDVFKRNLTNPEKARQELVRVIELSIESSVIGSHS